MIGLYFGFFGNQSTSDEYLLGGKRMGLFPVGMSLVASHISGITLLAIPSDVYFYGGNMFWIQMAGPFVAAITAHVFLPVLFNNNVSSSYEYLEKRFDVKTRIFASFLFDLSMFFYLPIVIYIPALAFSTATGVEVNLIAPTVCAICIFYTTIGGAKAVIWSDTLQFSITIGSVIAIFILGVNSVDGFENIFDISGSGHRLDIFDFNIDPTRRDGFWSLFFGYGTFWLFHGVANQSCSQKYLSLPNYNKAKWSVYIFFGGMIALSGVCMFTGLIMYTKYSTCDPYSSGIVKASDGLLPYYVMDVAGHIPGLPGLFIAGIFCAALSTLSASLNCLAGTIYEDLICKFQGKEYNPKSGSGILKILVILIGIFCTVLVWVVQQLGGLFALAQSFLGIAAGPLLALFFMAALIPSINSTGAFYGSLIGMIIELTLAMITQYYKANGQLVYKTKPFSNLGCPSSYNSTMETFDNQIYENSEDLPFFLFRITHYYYALCSLTISIVVALAVSYFTKKDSVRVRKELLSPILWKFIDKDDDLPVYGVDNMAMGIGYTASYANGK